MTIEQAQTIVTRTHVLTVVVAVASLVCTFWLSGCHGGTDATAATLAPVAAPVATDPPPPAAPVTPPAAPTCPAGQSLTGVGAECCPTGDSGDGTTCIPPPPLPVCVAPDTGTYPNCVAPPPPAPSCTPPDVLLTSGPFAGECGPPPVVPPTPPATPPAPPVNPPPPDTCPVGTVGTYPVCIDPTTISLVLTLNVDPQTVTDSSLGVTASTEAVVTWSISSSVPNDSFTCYWGGSDPNPRSFIFSPTSVGPYPAQDGTVSISVTCVDTYGANVTQTVSLAVVPPMAPPGDQFTSFANPDGSYTFRWFSYLPAAECSVYDGNSGMFLVPGGTASGSSTTNTLYVADVFTLWCNGVADPSVSPISVSP
jgi:hypothetical protein